MPKYLHEINDVPERLKDDLFYLRTNIPCLAALADEDIISFYREFSATRSASWLIPEYGHVPFAKWLQTQYERFKFMGKYV